MTHALYDTLVPFYHLLDPVEDHADEMAVVRGAFAAVSPCATLLELGAGAGNNAFHLKPFVACTLSDLSPAMLALSAKQNPECEHVAGDMRTLRLGRTFDVVLVHDGVSYMTTHDELRAAITTAFVHTRPGGMAIFMPDGVGTFEEMHEVHEGDDGERSLRCLSWTWDPDPSDTTYVTDYAFLLREGTTMTHVHDRHVEGVFSRAEWIAALEEAGFVTGSARRPNGDGESDEVFVCTRP